MERVRERVFSVGLGNWSREDAENVRRRLRRIAVSFFKIDSAIMLGFELLL